MYVFYLLVPFFSRARLRIKATTLINASIWNALVVGEKHDDAVCAVNRHIMDRGYRTGRCHGDGGCFRLPGGDLRRKMTITSPKIRLIKRSVNVPRDHIPSCHSSTSLEIRGRIAMLSDVSRNDRATCNFKSTIRGSPSIVRIFPCVSSWMLNKRGKFWNLTRHAELWNKESSSSGDKHLFSIHFFCNEFFFHFLLLILHIASVNFYSTSMNASRIFFFSNIIEKYCSYRSLLLRFFFPFFSFFHITMEKSSARTPVLSNC